MHEEGRCASAGQCGGNLAADVAGLADPADDDAPVAVQDHIERVQEGVVEAVDQRKHGFAFDAKDLSGEVKRLGRGMNWVHGLAFRQSTKYIRWSRAARSLAR